MLVTAANCWALEVQTRPVDLGILWRHAEHGFLALCLAFDAVDHPL